MTNSAKKTTRQQANGQRVNGQQSTHNSRAQQSAPIKLDTFLPYQISVLADQIARRSSEILKAHCDLNLSHWRVMAAIADQPGRSAQQVVAVTPMDKGIVSRAVNSLIDQGYVRREASPTDGRLGHLFLTDTGESLYWLLATDMRKTSKEVAQYLQRIMA